MTFRSVLVGAAAAICGATLCSGAVTAAPDFGAALAEIRNAEQLIMAALQTGDDQELTSQSGRLFKIEARLLEATKPGDDRASCGMAAGDLSAIVATLQRVARNDRSAQSMLAADKIEQSYRRNLTTCERVIGGQKRSSR